jgi:hypothetical protein
MELIKSVAEVLRINLAETHRIYFLRISLKVYPYQWLNISYNLSYVIPWSIRIN